jgi:hypothetical protein
VYSQLQFSRRGAENTEKFTGIFVAGIFVAGIFVAGIFVAGIFVAGIFVAGIFVAATLVATSIFATKVAPTDNRNLCVLCASARVNVFSLFGMPNFECADRKSSSELELI